MPDEADLVGCTVLVVKDDYFIAMDAGRAVQRTGGVFGPVAHEHQALAERRAVRTLAGMGTAPWDGRWVRNVARTHSRRPSRQWIFSCVIGRNS